MGNSSFHLPLKIITQSQRLLFASLISLFFSSKLPAEAGKTSSSTVLIYEEKNDKCHSNNSFQDKIEARKREVSKEAAKIEKERKKEHQESLEEFFFGLFIEGITIPEKILSLGSSLVALSASATAIYYLNEDDHLLKGGVIFSSVYVMNQLKHFIIAVVKEEITCSNYAKRYHQ